MKKLLFLAAIFSLLSCEKEIERLTGGDRDSKNNRALLGQQVLVKLAASSLYVDKSKGYLPCSEEPQAGAYLISPTDINVEHTIGSCQTSEIVYDMVMVSTGGTIRFELRSPISEYPLNLNNPEYPIESNFLMATDVLKADELFGNQTVGIYNPTGVSIVQLSVEREGEDVDFAQLAGKCDLFVDQSQRDIKPIAAGTSVKNAGLTKETKKIIKKKGYTITNELKANSKVLHFTSLCRDQYAVDKTGREACGEYVVGAGFIDLGAQRVETSVGYTNPLIGNASVKTAVRKAVKKLPKCKK